MKPETFKRKNCVFAPLNAKAAASKFAERRLVLRVLLERGIITRGCAGVDETAASFMRAEQRRRIAGTSVAKLMAYVGERWRRFYTF